MEAFDFIILWALHEQLRNNFDFQIDNFFEINDNFRGAQAKAIKCQDQALAQVRKKLVAGHNRSEKLSSKQEDNFNC